VSRNYKLNRLKPSFICRTFVLETNWYLLLHTTIVAQTIVFSILQNQSFPSICQTEAKQQCKNVSTLGNDHKFVNLSKRYKTAECMYREYTINRTDQLSRYEWQKTMSCLKFCRSWSRKKGCSYHKIANLCGDLWRRRWQLDSWNIYICFAHLRASTS
jgi:hypothetical protein